MFVCPLSPLPFTDRSAPNLAGRSGTGAEYSLGHRTLPMMSWMTSHDVTPPMTSFDVTPPMTSFDVTSAVMSWKQDSGQLDDG